MGALVGWPESVIALVLAAFAAGVGIVTVQRFRENLFHPLVLVGGIMTYYVLVPAAWLLATGGFRVPHRAGAYVTLLTALLVIAAAYTLIVVAYRRIDIGALARRLGIGASSRGRRTAKERSPPRHRGRDKVAALLVVFGIAGVTVGLVAYLYYVLINGGFVRLVTISPRTAFQTVPNTGRFKVLGTAGIYAGMITTLVGFRPRIENRTLPRRTWAGVAGLCAVALLVAVTLRSRMNIAIVGGFLLLYFYGSGWISKRRIVGATAALVVFGLSFSFFERIITRGSINLSLLIHPFISTIRLEIIMEIIRQVPDTHPFQWGGTFWYILPLPIDFGLFPPRMGNQLEAIVFGTSRKTYTAPAMYIAELWLNFGLVGVLMGSAVYGAALKFVQWTFAGAQSVIARGLYPFALLAVLSALPTSVEWAVKSMAIRLGLPIAVALVTAWLVARRVDVERFVQAE
jgi:hypothetical protein